MTFLPGAAGSAAFWTPLITQLPATWRIDAVDLPGLGDVPAHPSVRSYDDLVEYVAARWLTPAILVSQSMGCYVALQLALRYPDLVSHLVLVAATGGLDMAQCGALDWRREYAISFPNAAPWARSNVADLTDVLDSIRIPVQLIWATQDALSPLAVALNLARRIPSSSLVTFETNDHWLVRQFPTEVAVVLRSFIERDGR